MTASLLNKIVDLVFEPTWNIFRDQRKGVLVGGIIVGLISVVILLFFINPKIDKLTDFGVLIGTYEVPKGYRRTVAAEELDLRFENDVYFVRNRTEESADTIFYYPSFSFYTNNSSRRSGGRSHYNFSVGRKIYVATKFFYYTIELKQLIEKGKDTSAVFDVYRRSLPENINKKI